MTRCKFQFFPGQEPELVPEEKVAVFERFEQALKDFLEASVQCSARLVIADTFLAGYRAGYGHAKDDAQQEMHVASGRLPERKA